jgi:hypothetical protein
VNVAAGRTVRRTWTVQLPPASDWSVVANVEPDYTGPQRVPFESDSVNNSAMLELGHAPAERLKMLEEWLAHDRTRNQSPR